MKGGYSFEAKDHFRKDVKATDFAHLIYKVIRQTFRKAETILAHNNCHINTLKAKESIKAITLMRSCQHWMSEEALAVNWKVMRLTYKIRDEPITIPELILYHNSIRQALKRKEEAEDPDLLEEYR